MKWVLAVLCFAAIAASSNARPVLQPVNDFYPTNFTVGILYVYDIVIGGQAGADLVYFSAQAVIGVPDQGGRDLSFNVSGQLGINPFVVGFDGNQNGTWSPFPTSDLQLDFLTIWYNSTLNQGKISGGEKVPFGAWTTEVDIDFVGWKFAAIGFVVTDAKPSFNGMPGAPAHAFDAADSLMNAGLVISSYDGQFQFTSGADVTVHQGTNLFAATVFDGVTIQYSGMVHFAGGFDISLTATAQGFSLGTGIDIASAVVTVQLPQQPFYSMNVQATWAGLQFTMQGAISTTDIQFSSTQSGTWAINHGHTPVEVSNMLITFDHIFSPASTTGELRGTVQWGTLPAATGIMKYPADSQALGCFSLTVIIGDPSTSTNLNGVVAQAVGNAGNASDNFPADSGELFGNGLESITLSVYPDCGAIYLGATVQTNQMGTVSMSFALFEYVPIQSVLAEFAQAIPDDPPVQISGSTSYTVGAKEVLQSLANAFATIDPPILVADAYLAHQSIAKGINTVMGTAGAMRQQLLVQLTEHNVQLDAMSLLQATVTALAGETTTAPDSYVNATWAWNAALDITGAHWPISEPAGLYFTDGTFALASATFQMTVGDGSIMAEQGFNFLADFTVSQSTLPALSDVEKVMASQCQDKAFQVSGYVGNAQAGWFLQGALTAGCIELGSNLLLSQTSLRVQSTAPQVSFESVLTFPQTQDMSWEVSGQFSSSSGTTQVQLTGDSQSVYQTHVGAKPLEIDNCNLQMTVTVGGQSGFAAQMSGAVTIDDQTEVSASSSFDSTTPALSFSLTIHEDHPILLFNLLKLLIGDQAFNNFPMPQSGKDKLAGVYFVQGSMSLSTQPPSLSGGVQVLGFYELLVSASISFNNGQVAFGMSVEVQSGLLDPIKLSDILPNITIIDEFRMRTPVIILATTPTQITIPGIEVTFNVKTGFNFAAFLALDNSTPRSTQLTKWLGNNTVLISGVIDPAAAQFELQAQAGIADIPIVGGFDLTDAGFFIHVDTPTVEVGFDASAQLVLSSATPTAANTIVVSCTFDVGTAGASFTATITGAWTTPFGVKGVTLESGTVTLALGSDWLLGSFGISGTLQVGNVQGTALFQADGLILTQTVVAATLASVSLERDILTAICGGTPKNMFADGTMQSASFSINPTLHTVAGKYPPGIAIAATNFVIGGITLSMVEFAIDPVLGIQIIVDASSSGTSQVSVGANNLLPFTNWQMDIDLMLALNMGIHINGQINFAGIQSAAAVDIDLTNFQLALNFSSGVVTIDLAGAVQSGNDPFNVPDLALSGLLDLNGYLQTRLLYYAQQTQNEKGPEEEALQKQITNLQNDIATLNEEIAQKSQNDTAAKQAAEQAVANAQTAVNNAKAKVQDLNNQIAQAQQNLKNCGSHDYVCQAKYKAEVVSLQAALVTADGALDAATEVLTLAQEALQKIPDPDTDPQILGWKAEVVTDQGLLATAQGALDADQALTNLCTKVLQAGAAALQPRSLQFSSTSYIAISHNQAGNVEIVGQFLGKPVDINIGCLLTDADNFVQNVWAQLQKMA
eukprot:TRINITY_DN5178_c0_g1_i1.p1 TRINITY_DN5178_c0_g1~~TRINITY_DN5178_c0_g1_i1.p1  ORF type:complete len:1545 (+),score=439.45 TRINITY_DN5178_c0_g1_i1:40-4674(+)